MMITRSLGIGFLIQEKTTGKNGKLPGDGTSLREAIGLAPTSAAQLCNSEFLLISCSYYILDRDPDHTIS